MSGSFDENDLVDIEDFDIIAWLQRQLSPVLQEELYRAERRSEMSGPEQPGDCPVYASKRHQFIRNKDGVLQCACGATVTDALWRGKTSVSGST